MALPAYDNQIAFSDIETEFGQNPKRSLGSYRISDNSIAVAGGDLTNLPLDEGIPQTGPIAFSDFHSKRLNIIVNYYSPKDGGYERPIARNKYINNLPGRVHIVGQFIAKRPPNSSGKKVFIHVNKTIKSVKDADNNKRRVALRTGQWDSNTDLRIDVGGTGKILGAGGDAGDGTSHDTAGKPGKNGNSAIGLGYGNASYPVIIKVSTGSIVAGGGGGGGGGGGAYDQDIDGKYVDNEYAGGGGGGGGAGSPPGLKGLGYKNSEAPGEDGNDGTELAFGTGGAGGNRGNEAIGGDGGNGGALGGSGNDGGDGQGNRRTAKGGKGGDNGYWLVANGHNHTLINEVGNNANVAGNSDNGVPV